MKVAVITGAGSGIGAATARAFARQGMHVIGVDVNEEAVAAVADEVDGEAYVCDVADAGEVMDLAAQIGPVDVLVNNAGVGVAGPFLDIGLEDWQWLRGINLDGVAHGCLAFGPGMVERGSGQVVNIASGSAYVPSRNMASYCATKAAVVMLSQCLRADWEQHGVGVSVVCPGVINTGIHTRTRFHGSMVGRDARHARAFRFGHSADLVAKAVVDCVERNRDVVPVGIESKLAYKLLRGAPQPIQNLIARRELP